MEEGRAAGAAESWAVVVASADAQREWWVGRWGAVATVAGVETVEAARVAAARVAVREVMAMAMATGLMAAVAEMPAAAQEAA